MTVTSQASLDPSVQAATDRVAQVRRRLSLQALRTRWALMAPALLVIGIFGLGPLTIVAIYSFLEPGAYGGVVWNFSPQAYVQFLFEKDLFDDTLVFTDAYLSIFARSIGLAAVTTVVCLILGFPTAYFMATRPPSQRTFWLFLITLPFWTNLLIRTYAMFVILRDDGVINATLMGAGLMSDPIRIMFTDTAIAIGLLYAFLPFMVLPLYASLEKLDFRYVEAGYDLYASRWKVLWRIIVPLSRPGIIAGSILCFIPAIGAYVTPMLLGGGKQLMIGNLIALQFGASRNWPFGCAASLILLAMVMVALLYYVRNVSRKGMGHG